MQYFCNRNRLYIDFTSSKRTIIEENLGYNLRFKIVLDESHTTQTASDAVNYPKLQDFLTLFYCHSFPSLVSRSLFRNLTLSSCAFPLTLTLFGVPFSFSPLYLLSSGILTSSLFLSLLLCLFWSPVAFWACLSLQHCFLSTLLYSYPLHCQNTDKWDLAPLPILKRSPSQDFPRLPHTDPPSRKSAYLTNSQVRNSCLRGWLSCSYLCQCIDWCRIKPSTSPLCTLTMCAAAVVRHKRSDRGSRHSGAVAQTRALSLRA